MEFKLNNVYVAGRRFSGSATGNDEKDAFRRFVARYARDLKVDVADAIINATRIKGFKVEKAVQSHEIDKILPSPNDYTDWPAMRN